MKFTLILLFMISPVLTNAQNCQKIFNDSTSVTQVWEESSNWPKQAFAAALKGLQSFFEINRDGFTKEDFGYSTEEFKNSPYGEASIFIGNFTKETNRSELLELIKPKGLLYPLKLKGEIRAWISLDKENGLWSVNRIYSSNVIYPIIFKLAQEDQEKTKTPKDHYFILKFVPYDTFAGMTFLVRQTQDKIVFWATGQIPDADVKASEEITLEQLQEKLQKFISLKPSN